MKKISFIFIILLLSAKGYTQAKNNLPPKELFACWKASYEENDEKTKCEIYRPCSYPNFRPSMFRLEIEFFTDGKCKFLHVGATDNHYFVEGKWIYDKNKKTISVLDDKEKLTYKFKLKKVSKDLMKTISLN